MRRILFFIISLPILLISLTGSAIDLKNVTAFGPGKKPKLNLGFAENSEIINNNFISKGDVQFSIGDLSIRADKAIINLKTNDFEAIGNVVLSQKQVTYTTMPIQQYFELKKDFFTSIKIISIKTDNTGAKKVNCIIRKRKEYIKANKVSGNLTTGLFYFTDFSTKYKSVFANAQKAYRYPDGSVELKDALLTTCDYCTEHQEHYSISAGKVKIFPYPQKSFANTPVPDPGDHSIWAYDCYFNLGGHKIFWIPMFYKPKDENWGLANVRAGYESDYGVQVLIEKKYHLSDYPWIDTKPQVDIFSERGVGFGDQTTIQTRDSSTEVFFWNIYDRRPYNTVGGRDEFERNNLFEIPNYRYDARVTHLSNLTDRLSIRANFEMFSDINFLEDWFRDRGANQPEEPTIGAIEYQNDYFALTANARPKVNSFFSDVQRLPELRLNIQRQELFSNIYYQSQSSFGYYERSWRDFDIDNPNGPNFEPDDYSSIRLDTVNFLYFPIQEDLFNFIPRMGGRITFYSDSTENTISQNDILTMLLADMPSGINNIPVINYDDDGGTKFRLIGEIGAELNTQFYQSWQDVKSAFFNIDGLRHVAIPYINYTFIPDPTVPPSELYFFDDIDRIARTNFIRFGLRQRLQTRQGSSGKEEVKTIVRLENYFDYFFNEEEGFSNVGDLGTVLLIQPNERITIGSILLLDLGQSDLNGLPTVSDEDARESRSGIDTKWINKWESRLRIKILENLWFNFAYVLTDRYRTRPAFSMGSTLTQIDGGSFFFGSYTPQQMQQIRLGVEGVVPFDEKIRGAYDIFYDLEAGFIRTQRLSLKRQLHCWEVAFEASQRTNRDEDGKNVRYSFIAALYLRTTPGSFIKRRNVPFAP